jgi:hypothetical protein
MNIHSLSNNWKGLKGGLTSLTTEGDPGPIATQCIAVVRGEKVTARRFLLTEAAGKLTAFTQRLVAGRTPRMKDETVGRGHPSKGGCQEELMAHSATTVRLLKIPEFLLTLVLFMRPSQSHPSFPLLLLSFLPRLLQLPLFPLGRQTPMPLVLVELFTYTTDLFVFMLFSFSSRKSL